MAHNQIAALIVLSLLIVVIVLFLLFKHLNTKRIARLEFEYENLLAQFGALPPDVQTEAYRSMDQADILNPLVQEARYLLHKMKQIRAKMYGSTSFIERS